MQAYRAYEKTSEKWHKEDMPRKGKGGISEEGQAILEDGDIWENETTLRGAILESRKRKRTNVRRRFVHDTSERTSQVHIHNRLVPPGGGGKRLLGE
jgi:hypothetical protein